MSASGRSDLPAAPVTSAAAPSHRDDWRPTASLENLKFRAWTLALVRAFLQDRGYWEVDTPILSADTAVDAHIEPMTLLTAGSGAGPRRLFLQTSPEFCLKRLLAAGAEAIYQIGHVFRAGEAGLLHNPEFTLVEWYRRGADYRQCIAEVAALVTRVLHAVAPGAVGPNASPPRRADGPAPDSSPATLCLSDCELLTYQEAFLRHAGVDPHTVPLERLRNLAGSLGLDPVGAERDDLLNFLLAELIEPHLGLRRPTFLFDYPASQAALAQVRPGNPPVALRFELYIAGIELCNGYQELTDPAELRRRNEQNNARRRALGKAPLPVESRLLAAMGAGLPECAGVALGFDRLVMLARGARSLAEVIAFPTPRE